MQYLGAGNALGGFTGINVFDSNNPSNNILSPLTINTYSVLTIPAYWRAINFKTSNLTSFPRTVRKGVTPLDVPHALDRLLMRRPNNYQSAGKLWRTFFFHGAHYQNGYLRIKRSIDGAGVDSLHNINPDMVLPFRYSEDPNDLAGLTQYYYLRTTSEILVDDDVIHYCGLSFDGMVALNPIWLHRQTYQRALLNDQYMTRLLEKGGVIRGTINFPASATQEQIDQVTDVIARYFSGATATRDILKLVGGATFDNKTVSPTDGKLIEQTTYTTKQIAQITDVPQHFLMDDAEGKYNNNIAQAGEDVVRYCFRPMIELLEDEMTLKLLTEAEQDQGLRIHIDPNALLRGDRAGQVDEAVALVAGGIESKNEGRASLGMKPSADPDADKLKTSGDTTPKPPAEPPTPAGPGQKVQNSQEDDNREFFSALKPVLEHACQVVEKKTEKAFASRAGKEMTIWSNVFAGEQETFTREALAPIAAAAAELKTTALDVQKIANRYAAAIRKRAADGTVRTLSEIVGELTDA